MFHNRRAARPRLRGDFQQRAARCNQMIESPPGQRARTSPEEVLGRRIDEADLVIPAEDEQRQGYRRRDIGRGFLVWKISGNEQ
jgi:hypothetical protein